MSSFTSTRKQTHESFNFPELNAALIAAASEFNQGLYQLAIVAFLA